MIRPTTTKRATFWRSLLLTVLAAAVCLLAAGCDDAVTSAMPETSIPSPSSTEITTAVTLPQGGSNAPVVSRWPPGVAAIVVLQSDGYAVVDENGVRFKLTNPDQSTEQGPSGRYVNRRAADIVVSNNGKYLAYRFGGGDLAVVALDTGAILGTMKAGFTDDPAAISDDGRLVVLVDEGTGPGIVTTAPGGPHQTVSLADVTTGEISVPGTIAKLVPANGSRDDPFLNGVAWLSDQSVFLLQVDDRPISTTHSRAVYLYDPVTDELTRAGGLLGSMGAMSAGGFVGYTRQPEAASGQTSTAADFGPVVWHAGGTTSFVFDPDFTGGVGAVSPDGTAVIMGVGEDGSDGAPGWQLFRLRGDVWRPASKAWPVPGSTRSWNPWALGGDDRTAWGFDYEETPSDPTTAHQYLRALDTETGTWTDWLRLADLLVDPSGFRILQVILDQ